MTVTEITSRDNPLIKRMALLQRSAHARRREGQFVLEGLRTLQDAAENGVAFECLLVTRAFWEKETAVCTQLSSHAGQTCFVSPRLFESFCDTTTPQGIAALASMPRNDLTVKPNGVYLALDHLQDPANLGAIARTAEALGVDGLIVSEDTVDPFSPKSLRASMGTLLRLPLCMVPSLADWLKAYPGNTYACVAHGEAQPLGRVDFTSGGVAVIGNEANGLSDSVRSACRYAVTIPMAGRAESLNAAVAAALVIWEMRTC